jgi:thiopeptide-type bacteriocin biosynthesis protein
VPDRVQVTEADHRIDLDLSVPFHRQLLRHELTRRRGATVQETADLETADTGGTGLGWLNGHANEIVVPLTVYGGAPRRPAPTGRIRVEAHGHPPGGAWVYAKLYCEDHRHRDVLVDHLPALLGELAPHADRWFFIRYRDPDPHLRLRFHGSPERLNGLLLPRLHDWAAAVCDAGFARRLVLDTYEPEVARYGGDAAIRHAEEVFAADSDAVLAQLAAGADLPPELLAAAGYVHIAQSFLGPEWTRWVGQWFTDTEHHRVFQEHRRQATLVVGCDGDWSALWALAGGSRADETWRRRAAAVATYAATVGELAAAGRLTTTPDAILTGLFHMHHNRLIGADRTSEDRTHAIVRGVVHAHLGRRRAGR